MRQGPSSTSETLPRAIAGVCYSYNIVKSVHCDMYSCCEKCDNCDVCGCEKCDNCDMCGCEKCDDCDVWL